jgi:hypothetical protein
MTDLTRASMPELISESTTRYVIAAKPMGDPGGGIVHFAFPNGWGASVIRYGWTREGHTAGTYGYEDGLFEVALLDRGGAVAAHPDLFPLGEPAGWRDAQSVEALLVTIMHLEVAP